MAYTMLYYHLAMLHYHLATMAYTMLYYHLAHIQPKFSPHNGTYTLALLLSLGKKNRNSALHI